MTCRALLLDLDDTLIDDRCAMAQAILALRAKLRHALDEADERICARWDALTRELWVELSAGRTTMQGQRRTRVRRMFDLEASDAEADRLFDDYLAHYETHWRVFPGTPAYLAATAHLPRIVVTNGKRTQALRKLERLGLDAHFRAVVTPDDCGCRKPDAAIFLHALGLLGLAAAEVMMVGDNLASDIEPALKLGMQVFHVDPASGRSIEHAVPPDGRSA